MIRRISKYLPGKILKQITQALIESQVNYCSVVWGNASVSELRRLQIAQNKAARIVLRWRYGYSVVVMLNALGWSSINKIIEKKHAYFISQCTPFKTAKLHSQPYLVGKRQISKY